MHADVTRLERSIAWEVIPNFFIGTALYVAVFLVQRVIAQPYLSALNASSFAPWLLYQIPAFALQAFPIAAVFAVLLAFGRLARENELLAAAAGGVSLLRVVRPVLWFGVLIAIAGFAIAEFVAPRANEIVSNTWWRGVSQSGNALERVVGKPLPVGDRVLYIGGIEKGEFEKRAPRIVDGEHAKRVLRQTRDLRGERHQVHGVQELLRQPR
ncbi:MAG: LptF/LptG family permease [Pleurocapsa sp. SU_196_0]|nr:LptF/LptG family permease [Pleurocapsa sp. SU_196_0]